MYAKSSAKSMLNNLNCTLLCVNCNIFIFSVIVGNKELSNFYPLAKKVKSLYDVPYFTIYIKIILLYFNNKYYNIILLKYNNIPHTCFYIS